MKRRKLYYNLAFANGGAAFIDKNPFVDVDRYGSIFDELPRPANDPSKPLSAVSAWFQTATSNGVILKSATTVVSYHTLVGASIVPPAALPEQQAQFLVHVERKNNTGRLSGVLYVQRQHSIEI